MVHEILQSPTMYASPRFLTCVETFFRVKDELLQKCKAEQAELNPLINFDAPNQLEHLTLLQRAHIHEVEEDREVLRTLGIIIATYQQVYTAVIEPMSGIMVLQSMLGIDDPASMS